ncbi:MAG TPA: LytTR family DNA-binding domain-containing protein [Bacteroidia bacterium]|nr:LytTR family DNA-binding domain-containing protein [Bacteroidia bacterium]
MINCIIVDDRIDGIEVIENHLKNFNEITTMGTFTDSIAALKFLENNKIDLVFLDIDMPNLDGLEFIESLTFTLGKNIPKFIYTTGHSKYALSGFELGASDYLLKPIVFKRFKVAIERILDNWKNSSFLNSNKDYFFVEIDGSKLKIKYENIAYIESERNYIHIREEKIVRKICKPMYYIENILSNHKDFIRVHKSFIVSANFVELYRGNDLILKINGEQKTISIGRTYKESVLKKLNNFK